MLKIKRERLDELEKFGFEKMKNLPRYCFYFEEDESSCLYVIISDCVMWINTDFTGLPNVIFDLIEAGMVEKEGDE